MTLSLEERARQLGKQAARCPRCDAEFDEPFYGPCEACRDELRDGESARPGPVSEYPPIGTQNVYSDRTGASSSPAREPAPRLSPERGADSFTKRTRRTRLAERPAAFFAWEGQTPEYIVDRCLEHGISRAYLIGDERGIPELRTWALGSDFDPSRHWLKLPHPVLRFGDVEVARASAWFGALTPTPAQALAARDELLRLMRTIKAWQKSVLFLTPAATGHDLMLRSISRAQSLPDGYPQLDSDQADWLRSITCQHRKEVMPEPHDGGGAVEVVELDMRLAYLATVRYGLPVAPERRRVRHAIEPGMGGWVDCEVTVPDGWRHIGLLPVKDDDGQGWSFPAEPGQKLAGWFHTRELQIAARNGWDVRTSGDAFTGKTMDPLKRWAEQVWALYKLTDGHPLGSLLRVMLRNIGLGAIGSLHGTRGVITRYTQDPDEVPDGATSMHFAEGETIGYHERTDKAGHPEWTGTTWAACRAKLATVALSLPHHEIVGMRTDAIYVTSKASLPMDEGRLGDLRDKSRHTHPGWPTAI